ncbi:SDR family oxidoreductase [Pseudonocardiaceae bacterium YIM PH 21723]|nr:SDR family oxidoreductase [Pseudonocardiaceae bacterium YIM PH 21723]
MSHVTSNGRKFAQAQARRVVSTDGVSLAVREYGDRAHQTIVLVHGWPDNSKVWNGIVDQLRDRYHLITYDVRGFGDSEKPTDIAAYELDQLAEDFGAVIDSSVPDRKVHVLAHDWGSIQMWHVVTLPRFSDRIASYSSISGPNLDYAGANMRKYLRNPRKWGAVLSQGLSSWYIYLMHVGKAAELLLGSKAGQKLFSTLVKHYEGPAAKHLEPFDLVNDGIPGIALYRANIFQHLGRPEPRMTSVPVQVLPPTNDLAVKYEGQTDIAEYVRSLYIRPIGGGHWAPATRPQVVARLVDEFIRALDGEKKPRNLARALASGPKRGKHDGKLVVITGAGSGIGRATALAFAKEGADVIAADINKQTAEETAELCGLHKVTAAAFSLDVTDETAMAEFAAQIKADYGVPDIVVNNAGVAVAGGILELEIKDWQRQLDINLWGVIHGSRLFGKQMAEQGEGGTIVNLSSMAAYTYTKAMPAYHTSKAAVFSLSQCIRGELATEGVNVIAICPGVVNTNITKTAQHIGRSAEEQARIQDETAKFYAKRNFSPERTAQDILKAVEKNTAVAPVTVEAKASYLLSRISPALNRFAGTIDPTR